MGWLSGVSEFPCGPVLRDIARHCETCGSVPHSLPPASPLLQWPCPLTPTLPGVQGRRARVGMARAWVVGPWQGLFLPPFEWWCVGWCGATLLVQFHCGHCQDPSSFWRGLQPKVWAIQGTTSQHAITPILKSTRAWQVPVHTSSGTDLEHTQLSHHRPVPGAVKCWPNQVDHEEHESGLTSPAKCSQHALGPCCRGSAACAPLLPGLERGQHPHPGPPPSPPGPGRPRGRVGGAWGRVWGGFGAAWTTFVTFDPS